MRTESLRSMKHKILQKLNLLKFGWFGDYDSWQEALQKTTGYDQQTILEKVRTATLHVKRGEAAYERDSVLFDKIQYSWPLLSALLFVAARNNGALRVLDYGGSLGSSYFQNRKFLCELNSLEWNIVEQANYVAAGRQDIQDNQVQFFYSIEECIEVKGLPDIVVLSGFIQYIEHPYEFLKKLNKFEIPFLLIDLTPFNYEEKDRITIQKVHPAIYTASYPCRIFRYANLINAIGERYDIFSEHTNELSIRVDGKLIQYRGLLAKLK